MKLFIIVNEQWVTLGTLFVGGKEKPIQKRYWMQGKILAGVLRTWEDKIADFDACVRKLQYL